MRTVLALAMGALAFGAVSAAGLLASRVATEKLRQGAATELAQAARHVAETLDRGMFERWRDVQVAAAHPVLRDPAAPPETKREALRQLDRTYPDYALVFLIRPDGRIEVTSRGVLEGVDVSKRDYFLGGREGPFAGDVHEAILLARYLGNRPNGEPPRFVDLAAPVPAADGRPAGVLAAHLFWDWAENVERVVLEPLKAQRSGAEALVLARDGTVLLGPAATRGKRFVDFGSVRAAAAGETGARLERWDAGAATEFLVGYAPTRGHAGYPGLGWTVLLRQDAEAAFVAAAALQREILLWAGAVALLAAAVGWLLAHAATRPIRALTAVVSRLAEDPGGAPDAEREAARLAGGSGLHEAAALGAAMAGLIGSQRRAAAALGAEEARLRAVLDRMPVGVTLAEAPSGRMVFHNRRAVELIGHPTMPEAEGVADYARFGGVLDGEEGTPISPHAYPIVRAARLGETVEGEEMRYRRGDGRLTWFEVSAARIADPAGGELAISTFADVAERKRAERQRELLIAELNHRVKNMLATVQALAAQTLRGASGAAAGRFVQEFDRRIRALARAHDLIAAGAWDEAEFESVARAALAPLLGAAGAADRIGLQGPTGVRIGPREAQALALALHELSTNALKHGALSVPGGRVALRWRTAEGPTDLIVLEWTESGGPALAGPPARRGFGTRLLERGLARDLGAGADVALDFAPAGLRAVVRFVPPHRRRPAVPGPEPFRGGATDRRREGRRADAPLS